MKKILIVSIGTLVPAWAMAHPSIMPHDHPHAGSLLPDIGALALAAVLVGAGFVAWRRLKKG